MKIFTSVSFGRVTNGSMLLIILIWSVESLTGKVGKMRVKGTKLVSNSSIKDRLGHLRSLKLTQGQSNMMIFQF